jgi:two-component sensor histidine kinase
LVILIIDPESGAIVDASNAACSFYGYEKKVLTSFVIDRINTAPLGRTMQNLYCSLLEGGRNHVFQHRLASGELRSVVSVTGAASSGRHTYFYSLLQEAPERRSDAPAIDSSRTSERDILIHELDHQVKNNLQLIESIIFLYLGRGGGVQEVQRLRNKIRAISAAYELSIGFGDEGQVPGLAFLKAIADNSRALRGEGRIDIFTRCDDGLSFRLDKAISVGIVVDSAISAAIERGDPAASLCVEVEARRTENSIELRIDDDARARGSGDDVDTAIARAAAAQLDAEVETSIRRSGGTSFRCVFTAGTATQGLAAASQG